MLMKNKLYIIISALLLLILSSCSSDNVVATDVDEEYEGNGARMKVDGFLPGDDYTRATLQYGAGGLESFWDPGDAFGVFATSKVTNPETGTLEDNTHAPLINFVTKPNQSGSIVNTVAQSEGFGFDPEYRFTSCYPLPTPNNDGFKKLPFSFEGQVQMGFVDMTAYYTDGKYNSKKYLESEAIACKHLGACDVQISPEMTPVDGVTASFHMRHVGAVARFFLLAPAKKLKLKELKLISDQKIFYTRGTYDLSSHPYNAAYTPNNDPDHSMDNMNYGLSLPQYSPCQISPVEDSKTDCLTLSFGSTAAVWTMYRTDDANYQKYGNYLLAYMMMYPVNTDGANVYVYVEAEDEQGNELKFKTKQLESKKMYSGCLYQWKDKTEEYEPIELTATLQSWQEVASGGISADLEK